MPSTDTARRRLALFSLALGGFAIGSSEFVGISLLPEITRSLVPGLALTDPEAATAQGAWFVSAYALGVVIGGPALGWLSGRFGARPVLVALVGAMAAGTLATALAPTLGIAVVLRVLSAIPHAAYFGTAGIAAAALLGERHRARGVAIVLGGLTFANVLGVPIATGIGHVAGWPVCYLLIGGLFALCLIGLLVALPRQAVIDPVAVRSAFAVLRGGTIWLVIVATAIAAAALFSVMTYVAPLLIDVAGLDRDVLPLLLVIIGIAMTVGNFLGGAVADHHMTTAAVLAFASGAAGILLLLIAPGVLAVAVTGIALVFFASGAVAPFVQVRLMEAAPRSSGMGAALNSSAFNLGSALGTVVGGLTIAGAAGYAGVAVVAALLLPVGVVLMTIASRAAHRLATAS